MTFECYAVYLVTSAALTVWLGNVLHREGRPFLVDCLGDSASTVDAVNDLLLVGFYLVNLGWIALTMRSGVIQDSLRAAIEFLSYRLGLVSLLLGTLHLMNLVVLTLWKTRLRSLA